jgi:hypothetical protein
VKYPLRHTQVCIDPPRSGFELSGFFSHNACLLARPKNRSVRTRSTSSRATAAVERARAAREAFAPEGVFTRHSLEEPRKESLQLVYQAFAEYV